MQTKTDRHTPALLALCLAALLALAGCGGGCDEEDAAELQRRNPTVNCAQNPALCK